VPVNSVADTVLRAWSWWIEVVPELASDARAFRLRNTCGVWVTEANYPDAFAVVTEAIEEGPGSHAIS